MADTLEASLTSVLEQVDSRVEVVVVDDGSSDNSIEVLRTLQSRYDSLRLIPLVRDRKRKLGFTRNISVESAKGTHVLLHLDCDDVFGPYLMDYVKVFHRIEACIGSRILLSGQHINMGQKDFLLRFGPYRNIYRGEDRDLWQRLARIDAYVPFDHVNFVQRLHRSTNRRVIGSIKNTLDHMRNDFRTGISVGQFIRYEYRKRHRRSWKHVAFRGLVLAPAWALAHLDEPLPQKETLGSPEAFAAYREERRGTYAEIMRRHGCDADLSYLRPEARRIFE